MSAETGRGAPSRADVMPPGSVCGFCAVRRHIFRHPNADRDTGWRLEDGCPCCETHIPADTSERHFPSKPPLGYAPPVSPSEPVLVLEEPKP